MWMSPDWYQTHQLCNTSKDFCATLNCYRYGEDDEVQWNKFDFLNNDGEMENFMPNTDFNFGDLMRIIQNENWEKSKAFHPANGSAASNSTRLDPHYVVLMGDVKTGKSTIVEKISGVQDRSSNSSESFTKESTLFWTPDRRLIISDTPGTNAMKDKLSHNCEVAVAFNYAPVSRILIVAKADTRIDNVVDYVREGFKKSREFIYDFFQHPRVKFALFFDAIQDIWDLFPFLSNI